MNYSTHYKNVTLSAEHIAEEIMAKSGRSGKITVGNGNKEFRCPCPAHGGQDNNLAVWNDGVFVGFKCWSKGCSTAVIKDALDRLGIQHSYAKGAKTVIREHFYYDPYGNFVYKKIKYLAPEKKKGFSWKTSVSKGVEKVPFLLPEFLKKLKAHPENVPPTIFITEGEKDCENLSSLGFISTTTQFGAGAGADKWVSVLRPYLPKKSLIKIFRDSDEPGHKHAKELCEALTLEGHDVQITDAPHPYKDASEWIEAGATAEMVLERIESGKLASFDIRTTENSSKEEPNQQEELNTNPDEEEVELSEEEIEEIRKNLKEKYSYYFRKDDRFEEMLMATFFDLKKLRPHLAQATFLELLLIENLWNAWSQSFRDERRNNYFGFLTRNGDILVLPTRSLDYVDYMNLVTSPDIGFGKWLKLDDPNNVTYEYQKKWSAKKQQHVYVRRVVRASYFFLSFLEMHFTRYLTSYRSRVPNVTFDPQLHSYQQELVLRKNEEGLRLVYPVLDLVAPIKDFDNGIVKDYLQHYPDFLNFLDHIVACRFGGNGKRAYHWLHAKTDWGKTLLFGPSGVFGQLGLVASTSMEELDLTLAGNPCGFTATQFKNTWILHIDEFSGITNNVKKLDASLSFSPKHKPIMNVPLYLKVFTSADHSASSLTNAGLGVESQHATRWTYDNQKDSPPISKRPLFEKNPSFYVDNLASFVATYLNEKVSRLKLMQKYEVLEICRAKMNEFFNKFSIVHESGELKDSLADIAQLFKNVVCSGFFSYDTTNGRYEGDSSFGKMSTQFQEQFLQSCKTVSHPTQPYVWIHGVMYESLYGSFITSTYAKNLWAQLLPRGRDVAQKMHDERFGKWQEKGNPKVFGQTRGIAFLLIDGEKTQSHNLRTPEWNLNKEF